jgi:lipopolysaccharide/colanic/teichoic acid biosynthesis glycosyltransferase
MSRVTIVQQFDNDPACSNLSWHAGTVPVLAPARISNLQLAFGDLHDLTQAVRPLDRRIKRVMDVAISAVLLLALSPMFAFVAVLVALNFGAPILSWKQRPGFGGRSFRLYRFRTRHAPHDATGRRLREDELDTSMGRLLRASGLDKLPQLFNILRGDLALVGPRALPPSEDITAVDLCTSAKPGLITMAHAYGGRLLAPQDTSALDAWYVRHATIRLDLAILAMAFARLMRGQRRNESAVSRARIEMWGCDQIVSQRAHR